MGRPTLFTHCQGPDTYQGGVYYGMTDPYANPDTADQPNPTEYRSKHNPFVYYHSITDNLAYCEAHDVPLGAIGTAPAHPDTYDSVGTLRVDLRSAKTAPAYSFITPN